MSTTIKLLETLHNTRVLVEALKDMLLDLPDLPEIEKKLKTILVMVATIAQGVDFIKDAIDEAVKL